MKLRAALKRLTMRFARTGTTLRWWNQGISRQAHATVGNGSNSSVVMAPLQWMMRTFPEAPLTIDRLQGTAWEQEDDHELIHLLERPNPYYSGDLLWRATVAQVALDGNAYWVKIRDPQLRVVQIWWIPSVLIEPCWPRDGSEFITHYEYAPGGEKVTIKTEDVVHFRWDLDPDNDRKGLSPLASVLREVFADDEAGRFAASLLANMGVPGLIISPDTDQAIPDDDLAATQAAIMQKTTGARRGEPMVFGSATKVQQFGFSPQQMDMRSLRKVPEERVSGALGVAAIVCGLGAGLDRSTFANFAEAREASYEGAMIPLQRLFAAELKHQLLPDFEPDVKKVRPRFDLEQVRSLQEDQNAIIERKLKELDAGVITMGEYRAETGREVKPEHDLYLRNLRVVEVRVEDLGAEPDPVPAPLANADPFAPKPGEDPNQEDQPKRKRLLKVGTIQQRRLNEAYEKNAEHLAASVSPRIGGVFDDLGREAMQAFKATKAVNGVGLKADDAGIRELALQILAAVDVAKHAAKLKTIIEGHYSVVADNTVSTLNSVFDLQVNLPDYKAREIIAAGGKRAGLVDMTEGTREALFRSLLDGRTLGEGQDELARRIRSEVSAGRFSEAGPQYRARLIARTETKFAQNVSAMAAYQEAGATRLIAFDAQSGHSDPTCIERNGREFSYDEADQALAETHPNCTLSFGPVFA